MRCLGLTKTTNYRRRCPTDVRWWRPYCWQHWRQPLVISVGFLTIVGVISGLAGYTARDILLFTGPPPSAVAFESRFLLVLEGERGYVEVTPGFVLNITNDGSKAEEFYFLSDDRSRYVTNGSIVRLISVTTGHQRRVCVGGKDTRDATKERLKVDGSELADSIAAPQTEVNQREAARSQFVVKHANNQSKQRIEYIKYGDVVTFRCVYRDALWRLDDVYAEEGKKIVHAHIVAATGGIGEYDKEHATGDSAEDAVPRFIITAAHHVDESDFQTTDKL
jgi:hypothetical protein